MSRELEFSKDPAIDVSPEPSLPWGRILQCEGALALPGLATTGDPEDDEEEEDEKEKKQEEDEDEEENDGEEEEVPWRVAGTKPGDEIRVVRRCGYDALPTLTGHAWNSTSMYWVPAPPARCAAFAGRRRGAMCACCWSSQEKGTWGVSSACVAGLEALIKTGA